SPNNSSPLYSGSETITSPLTFTFSVSDDDPTVTKQPTVTNISMDIALPGASIAGNTLTITSLTGLYPFTVKTVKPLNLSQHTYDNTFKFSVGEKIINYTKESNSPKTINVTVTASTGATNLYQIIVQADFSANQPALQDAVKRSNF
ncbi:MAG: hypothetical protein JHC38_08785, partial [Thiotrichales bacterium]|nr:hypothetical protein [Thiotrichales bacterium]